VFRVKTFTTKSSTSAKSTFEDCDVMALPRTTSIPRFPGRGRPRGNSFSSLAYGDDHALQSTISLPTALAGQVLQARLADRLEA
jgi:hypothetical protein